MLKKDLAEQLGISGAMVSRLAKRGMPTDSLERAQRWRKRHLEPGRMKGVRYEPNKSATTAPRAAAVATTPPAHKADGALVLIREVELAARCSAIALGGTDPECSALMLSELRELLRKLPSEVRPRMPVCVWIALVDWALHDESEVRHHAAQDDAVTPDDFASLVSSSIPTDGAFWLHEACDWEDYSLNGLPDAGELVGEEHEAHEQGGANG